MRRIKKTTKKISHLMCMDFESWTILDKTPNNILTNKQRIELDKGETLKSLDNTLSVLKKYNQKITFFVVFKLEELYPGIIKKILDSGHEVGWHGYSHTLLTNESILESELKKSEQILKKYKIKGFQAPNIIFFKNGYKLLKKFGFRYSSSIYGNSNEIYNFDGIYEIPVSTSNNSYLPKASEIKFPSNMSIGNLFKFGIPFGSSYFWSTLNIPYYNHKLKIASNKNSLINLFIHNWQLQSSSHHKLKHNDIPTILKNPLYIPYLINVSPVFEHLLSNFSFQKCIDYIKTMK